MWLIHCYPGECCAGDVNVDVSRVSVGDVETLVDDQFPR